MTLPSKSVKPSEVKTSEREKSFRPVQGPLRYVYISLGIISIIIGGIGVPLPVLPTTPFLLLAAYFFLRSSQTLYDWLIGHKTLGPFINDYIRYGVVPIRAKIVASLMIISGITISIVFLMPRVWWAQTGLALIGLAVILFLVSKPSHHD